MRQKPGCDGYVLLSVVMAITLIAVFAFMLNRTAAINTSMAVNRVEVIRARYVAEAGVAYAKWYLRDNCEEHSIINFPFQTHTYGVTIASITETGDTNDYHVVATATLSTGTVETIEADHNCPIDSDIIAYWKFDEGTGDIAYDETTNNYDGDITNAVWITSGKYDDTLSFEGSGDYVGVTGIDLANQSFSLECWAKRSAIGSYDLIIGQGSSMQNYGVHMGFRPSNVFRFSFFGNDLDTPVAYTDTDWHHWVGTFDASTKLRKIYRDGSEVASDTSFENYLGNGLFYIGTTWVGNEFDGLIDEVVVYDTAITSERVKQRYWKYYATMSSVIAYDNSGGGPGIQAGDQVVIKFNTETNGATIDASNIDTVLALSDCNSWLDGNGEIGGAVWSSVVNTNDTLTITLSDNISAPTVVECDTISLNSAITHQYGEPICSSRSFSGNFGVIIPEGLVAYYSCCHPNDGTVNANDGTVYGAVLTQDIRNDNPVRAYFFDGSDDYIDVPYNSTMEPSVMTLCAWVKTVSMSSGMVMSTDPDGTGCNHGYNIRMESDGKVFFNVDVGGCGNGRTIESNVGGWNDGYWHHIAATYDGTLKMFIDGVKQAQEEDGNYDKTNQSLRIGMIRNQSKYFNGAIDEIRIYNRVLTQSEIDSLVTE